MKLPKEECEPDVFCKFEDLEGCKSMFARSGTETKAEKGSRLERYLEAWHLNISFLFMIFKRGFGSCQASKDKSLLSVLNLDAFLRKAFSRSRFFGLSRLHEVLGPLMNGEIQLVIKASNETFAGQALNLIRESG